ncbi:nuclear transport factor 2 family protein (plasmid) [Rhizobium grahamii]|uniref:Nuclear transport factor 2 family protein n=1 Tax=Rhizobium grahamii TaxID=1120045 RepID=A0A5Q0CFV4_9HYPH|nr:MULTISPECIES: nuclear transport factor 2 family protein [Rhizobium]QFY62871.1 nuclear transport factor 2 family protein [Rhizobium grahamii]QRM52379.1 nuclear transport factor 2 family protein [Rhizobium sp. BG6]
MEHQQDAVLAAADSLVDAFGRHDRDRYFAAFAPEATFIFHNLDRRLGTRAEYEAEWVLWESRDGFRVRACRSSDRDVRIAGPIAIFTHSVETDLTFNGEPVTSAERETIVFEKQVTGEWLAIHEHLSPRP